MSDERMGDSQDVDWKTKNDEAITELSSLGRVSHRLAMTDGSALERVISLLLPRLLRRIGSNHKRSSDFVGVEMTSSSPVAELKCTYDKIHSKLIEMLSHTMKRTRADSSCQIPCDSILELLYDKRTQRAFSATEVDPFTLNLSLAFLTLGLPRCEASEIEVLLPGLFALVGVHSGIESLQSPSRKSQANQCAHLVLRAVEAVVLNGKSGSSSVRKKECAENEQREKISGKQECVDVIRGVCREQRTGAAIYDLFLDALVYQPVPRSGSGESSLPSPGMSQSGYERLLAGASLTAKNWAAEHARQSRLRELKLSLLDFISPCRRWALFEREKESSGSGDKAISYFGTARTVALLVVASGDGNPDVSERAASYLKAHMDSMRNTRIDGQEPIASILLGDPLSLSCCLLKLVLGDNVADSSAEPESKCCQPLGLCFLPPKRTEADALRTVILSTKRRMLIGEASSKVLSFTKNIFDDVPKIFVLPLAGGDQLEVAMLVGNLVTACCSYYLRSSLDGAGSKKNPSVACAAILCSFSIRLASLYDTIVAGSKNNDTDVAHALCGINSQCLATACSVLSTSSSPHTVQSGKQGLTEVKDSCYGVISTIARSMFVMAKGDLVFNCGAGHSTVPAASKRLEGETHSIATAALLFACASNEEETLRPRSVAALDALLGAYCRVLKKKGGSMVNSSSPKNPWQQTSVPAGSSASMSHNDAHPAHQTLSKSLFPLLWSAAKTSQPKSSRLAAARWASELMKSIDLVNACHILCFLAGDPDVTTASMARDGLGLGVETIDEEGDIMKALDANSSVSFSDIVSLLFLKRDSASNSSWRPNYYNLNEKGKCAALRFALICLLNDLYGGDELVRDFIAAISSSLVELNSNKDIDLLEECAICLRSSLATSKSARQFVAQDDSLVDCKAIGNLALSVTSSRARRHFAAACGILFEDIDIWGRMVQETAPEPSIDFKKWSDLSGVSAALLLVSRKLNEMQTNLFMASEVHGSAFLGASCVRALRSATGHPAIISRTCSDSTTNLWAYAASITAALGRGTAHSDDSIGNACSRALSIALSYDSTDAPLLEDVLLPPVTTAMNELRMSMKKYGSGDHTDASRAASLARAAGTVLAASTSGAGRSLGRSVSGDAMSVHEVRMLTVDALFALLGSTAFRKDPEISITVGEAIAVYADAYSPEGAVWTLPKEPRPSSFDDQYAKLLPPHGHIIYVLLEKETNATSPHKRNSLPPAMLAVVGRASKMLNNDKRHQFRAFIDDVLTHLDSFQSAFLSFLVDPKIKQLGRESAVLGLCACRGLLLASRSNDEGDVDCRARSFNERLLRYFGETTNFARSAMMETRQQNAERLNSEGRDSSRSVMDDFGEGAEVGGASGVGEAALGSYREMASAAVSLGRPDVLYSLMLLSVTHPVWASPGVRDRYNATSLLGESGAGGVNMAEMRQTLRPHIKSLIPRLLRACNDPNKHTREQMQGLWASLSGGGAEARSLITAHFPSVFDKLITDATSKLWRARAGACGALAEIIVGRMWEELGGGKEVMDENDVTIDSGGVRLLRLWRVTNRALDDVRLAVRESGQVLARSVRSLTIRLCDPLSAEKHNGNDTSKVSEAKEEASAAAAAATALRYLTGYGLQQPCAEAVGVCVSSLLGIVDVARPSTLQPVLPELIGSLAMSMSGLEPAALNYLQVRAAGENSGADGISGYDQLERMRLQLAQGGPIAGALHKCLGMMKEINVEAQKQVIPQIDSALRCGAGFATRAAAADAVSFLCSTCPAAFKFPGYSNANPTVRLLRALYFASERERGTAAKDKMAHALGSLATLSPGHSVRVLAARACERYSNATGSNDDPAARRAAAAALRAIAVRASAQFADGGSSNVWCRKVLPLAYLGQKDEDSKVSNLWKDVWEEGGMVASSGNSNKDDRGIVLEEVLLPHLVQECVNALNDVSWARRIAACAALTELAKMDVLAPSPRTVSPKPTAEQNSEVVMRQSRRRAQAASLALTNCARLLQKSRVWTGKNELVKATVTIAVKWVNLGTEDGCKNHIYWGWEEGGRQNELGTRCPWIPITQDLVWDDLFVGDNWFKENHEVIGESVNSLRGSLDSDQDDAQDQVLDFSDADNILGDTAPCDRDDLGGEDCSQHKSLTLSGLCHALLDQSFPSSATLALWGKDEILSFRSDALRGLSEVLESLSEIEAPTQSKYLYEMIAKCLHPVVVSANECEGSDSGRVEPPLIVARSIKSLSSAMWSGMGKTNVCADEEDIRNLSKLFCHLCGHSAWTVREESALAGAVLWSKADLSALRKQDTVSTLLQSAQKTAKDRKFWRVRVAGLQLLRNLVLRVGFSQKGVMAMPGIVGKTNPDCQLLLEAVLPYKETITKLAKLGLADNEPKVTAVATEILGSISWWP
uniref:Non-specific serine/threonine protein kinase n=1 Tax=Odontella aurita TaxID=265563 RepID=A0A7S4MII8_9STRA|mmetsp:Transcript_22418/g.66459  ORF Transcript_22418/g.66459 Transcript_22418/m.66459 type:complete len:2398 (+) Transcript_22418:245-7438(+)|eukprot:CAMPEP_0113576580 /NCGR_PEP_ID=MMETSP0015_2-20120614/28375_1 /TAXON_ID=2838 /ORGANISM="Odontella" /LENGTH=2397 /DNA_ID=CAMNT_0000480031 /DNA_START=174 /DNA_END=7367 /DNA_ORIENTATION=+ /assembly_acc=CAM_ASM_000160